MPNAPLNPLVSGSSRSILRMPVDLATNLGLKTYNRTFPRIEAALFLADVIVQLQGRASQSYAEEIEQVQEAITKELDHLEALITEQAHRADKLCNGGKRRSTPDAPSALDIDYTHAVRVDLAMRTPHVRRYADLLTELESTSRLLDQAWWSKQILTANRLKMENHLFRHCMKSTAIVERLARGLARRVRDDQEAPGYRDMLTKRTGRGPEAAEAVVAEDREAMTANEAASLQATEALAASFQETEAETPEALAATEASESTTHLAETAEEINAAHSATTDTPDGAHAEGSPAATCDPDADAESTAPVLDGAFWGVRGSTSTAGDPATMATEATEIEAPKSTPRRVRDLRVPS